MDTPSPETRRSSKLAMKLSTPKSLACRKIANSPIFLAKCNTDFSELSMSPLQLMDSPVQPAPMTPSTSSGESPQSKSSQYLKQTSTPSDDLSQDTPSMKNKAFLIASNALVAIKAKRRLIEEENSKDGEPGDTAVVGNAAKKKKTSPKPSPGGSKMLNKMKRLYGSINLGVSHRIRKPDKKKRSVSSISLTDLKKAKAEAMLKHPLDPFHKCDPVHSGEELTLVTGIENQPPVGQDGAKQDQPLSITVKPLEKAADLKNPMKVQSPQTPRNNKSKKEEKQVTPKIITRNWNQRYRHDNRERKFFKSRTEDSPKRVVTVSVNDNLK